MELRHFLCTHIYATKILFHKTCLEDSANAVKVTHRMSLDKKDIRICKYSGSIPIVESYASCEFAQNIKKK